MALYFNVFPKEADKFLKEAEESEKEYEDYQGQLYNKTVKYINSMTKEELVDALLDTFNYAPKCVYERFVRGRVGY